MGLFWSKFEFIFKTSSFSKYAQTKLSLDPGIPGPGTFLNHITISWRLDLNNFFYFQKWNIRIPLK